MAQLPELAYITVHLPLLLYTSVSDPPPTTNSEDQHFIQDTKISFSVTVHFNPGLILMCLKFMHPTPFKLSSLLSFCPFLSFLPLSK